MGMPQNIIERMPLTLQDPINKFRYFLREDRLKKQKTKEIFSAFKSHEDVRDNLKVLKQLHNLFPIVAEKSKAEDYLRAGTASLQRLRALEKRVPMKGKDILEIGTGYGETLFHKDKVSARSMTGVDFPSARKGFDALKTVSGLEESESLKYLTGDFLTVEFDNSQFDLIFSFDTFEHFDKPTEIFERAISLLRPNGYMCFVFGPLFRSPQGAHRFYYTGIPYFQNIFSDDTIMDFFEDINVFKEFSNHKGFDETTKARNPFSEMNRWKYTQFEKLFTGSKNMKIVKFELINNYQHVSLAPILHTFMSDCDVADLYATSIFTILKKR